MWVPITDLGVTARSRSMYEGGIRVPMGVRWPGSHSARRTSTDSPYDQSMDIYPTVAALELAATPIEHEIDGLYLSATIAGRESARSRAEGLVFSSPRRRHPIRRVW